MLNNHELRQVTQPIRNHLNNSDLLDLCINKPGEIFTYTMNKGWTRYEIPALTDAWIRTFIQASTVRAAQVTDKRSPILSTTLFTGERLQVVLPPAAKYPSITIRRPSDKLFSLEDLEAQGAFDTKERCNNGDKSKARTAKQIYSQGDFVKFFRYCVQNRLNIIISGATGSGKTTATKSLIAEIDSNERIITIEDAEELSMTHQNIVQLFYARQSDNDQQKAVTAKDLLVACLRMRPDRVLLSELRDSEAYFYLRNVNSGHPGSITSIHSNSPRQAIDQLILMIQQTNAAANMKHEDTQRLICSLVDVVVQWDKFKMAGILFPGLDI